MSILQVSFTNRHSADCSSRDLSKLDGTQLQLTPLKVNLVRLASADRCYRSDEKISSPRTWRANVETLYAKVEELIRAFGRKIIGAKSSSYAPTSSVGSTPNTKEIVKSPRETVREKLDTLRANFDEETSSYAEFKERQLGSHSSMKTLAADFRKFLGTRHGLSLEQATLLRQLGATLSRWTSPAAHQNQVYTCVPEKFHDEMEILKLELDKAASIIRGTYERDFGESAKAAEAEDGGLPDAPTNSNEQEPGARPEISAADLPQERTHSAEPPAVAAKAWPEEQAHGADFPAAPAMARPEEPTHGADSPAAAANAWPEKQADGAKRAVRWAETLSITIPERDPRSQSETSRTPLPSILKTSPNSNEPGLDEEWAVDKDLKDAYGKAAKLWTRVEHDNVSLMSECDLDEDDNVSLQSDRSLDEDSDASYESDSSLGRDVDLFLEYGVRS